MSSETVSSTVALLRLCEEDTRAGERLRKAKAPHMAASWLPRLSYNPELFFPLRKAFSSPAFLPNGRRLFLPSPLPSSSFTELASDYGFHYLPGSQALNMKPFVFKTVCKHFTVPAFREEFLGPTWPFSNLHVAASHSILRTRRFAFSGNWI